MRYKVETFLAINKYRVGALAIASGSLALSMHFFQLGLEAARKEISR